MSLAEIKKAMESGKIIIGLKQTLKNIRLGKVSRVYLSRNCPESTKSGITRYPVEVEVLNKTNEELGIVCKKPFSISVLSERSKVLSERSK